MFLRNLMSIDTEEMIRAQPMDSVVLIGGCDKTLPAQLMAAASADRPAVVLPVGPMLVGHFKGEVLGACTDCRRLWGQYRAGTFSASRHRAGERAAGADQGHLHGDGHGQHHGLHRRDAWAWACPAAARSRRRTPTACAVAEASGRLAAEMAGEAGPAAQRDHDQGGVPQRASPCCRRSAARPTRWCISPPWRAASASRSISRSSTQIGRKAPVLVDLKPSGDHYMEHFHWAGGNSRLMREIRGHLDEKCRTVAGRTLEAGDRRRRDRAQPDGDPHAQRTRSSQTGGMAVLRGNLAPRGAVIKHAAASPALLTHTGRAVVFDLAGGSRARAATIPALDVTADDILVLRNAGPEGRARHARGRLLPHPDEARARRREGHDPHLRRAHERHGLRHHRAASWRPRRPSAARSPWSRPAIASRLDVPKRKLELLVSAKELAARRKAWKAPAAACRQRPRLRRPLPEGSAAGRRRRRFRFPRSGKIVSEARLPAHFRRRHVLQLP